MGEKKRRMAAGGGRRDDVIRLPDGPTLTMMRGMSVAQMQHYLDEANATTDRAIDLGLSKDPEWLRKRFAEVDMVVGVFPHASERGGVGIACLKGWGRLKLLSQGKRDIDLTCFYWRCVDLYQAEAFCLEFGDGRQAMAKAEMQAGSTAA